MKTYFVLICKSSEGSVYASTVLYEAFELQSHMAHLASLGAEVIDVKVLNFDLSQYEHV